LLVDLALNGKSALIIGRGYEVEIRAKQLLAEGAKVTILSDNATKKEIVSRKLSKSLEIRRESISKWKSVLANVRPFLAVISTGDLNQDEEIARFAHSVSNLVYVVDRPHLNDLNMTGVAKLGDVRIAVSTHGLSPAMAGVLRRKIESIIDPEDILQVKLQGDVRSTLKSSIKDPTQRKKIVYKLIRDKTIGSMLQSNQYEHARRRALNLIALNSEFR
jgi:precorrin-2 dehydrogenase / sirohydrochlorin ferrochelatase